MIDDTRVPATAVMELRRRTDMPVMMCKRLLAATEGDVDLVIEWLDRGFPQPIEIWFAAKRDRVSHKPNT